jgi:MFS transporter, FSR family, fosmidomycin resistance protein
MKINKKALALLSFGHLTADIAQGALPALLPFFKEALNLSYTVTGIILLSANMTSSVIQPAFGYLTDRRPLRWLLPLAPFVACLGIAITGLLPSYTLLLVAVIISGLGIAGYHPEGFKTAHFFTGEKKATGMSIFSVGGNLGIALGPILALSLVTAFGLRGTLGLVVPGILLAAVMTPSIPWLTAPVQSTSTPRGREVTPLSSKKETRSLVILIGVVILRTWIQFGLITYIPFYYINYLKGNPLYAGKLVSTFLLAGAVGSIFGGVLADRWGHKRFLTTSVIVLFPLLLLFYNTHGILAFVVIGCAGMALISASSVTMVMGQSLLPQQLGMASGLMVGFAVGTGGIGVTLLGTIADTWGIPMAMKAILVLPLLGFGLTLLVTYPPKGKGG